MPLLCGSETLCAYVSLPDIAEMACSASGIDPTGPSQASDPLLEKGTPASSCPSGLPTDSNLPTNVGMRISRRRAVTGEPTVTKVSSGTSTIINQNLYLLRSLAGLTSLYECECHQTLTRLCATQATQLSMCMLLMIQEAAAKSSFCLAPLSPRHSRDLN